MERLLEVRQQVKSQKPTFLRQQGHVLRKIRKIWRAPKGMHSKMRKKLRGYRRQPSIGYSSPKLVRGFSPDGYKTILQTQENQLGRLEKMKDWLFQED